MDPRYNLEEVWRIKAGEIVKMEDPVIKESPLTIYLNDLELVTLLSTPECMDELAIGFLHSEGFLKASEDIEKIEINESDGIARVLARKSLIAEKTFLKRYITTGCGKGTSFYNLSDAVCPPVQKGFSIAADRIFELMVQAQQRSELFKITGGVHSSALCTREEILLFREDIGRHNTVDKLNGRCLLDGLFTGDKLLLTTGRISSEILIKVAKMGIPVIVSRSAPTDLAIRTAKELGVTIVAFVRNQRMNIYSCPERVQS